MVIGCTFCLPEGGTALSLDISQPAANPAALAMAILSSAKSRRRASSSPQVPLVIISQPLPGPVTGQSSPAPQVRPEKPDQSSHAATASSAATQAEVVITIEPDESPSSTDLTSLPVSHDQPTSEVTASEDPPTPEEVAVVVVSV